MENYNLKEMKMIAQGGEAKIFEIGEDRILRVLRKSGKMSLETEKAVFPLLRDHQVSVPNIYEYVEVDGRPAEVMQKITGGTMIEYFRFHPLGMTKEIKKLAQMQATVFDIEADGELHSIQDRVGYFSAKLPLMKKQLIDFTLKLLASLPEDNHLCHGDFHPGNILIQDGKYYIIDWSGAYRGSPLSDIAHTYLLLTHVPVIPGQSSLQHAIMSFAGKKMAKAYLNEVKKQKRFDADLFSKWTVVMAFLRTYYGMPSERPERINYIQKCYELDKKNIDVSLWFQ